MKRRVITYKYKPGWWGIMDYKTYDTTEAKVDAFIKVFTKTLPKYYHVTVINLDG